MLNKVILMGRITRDLEIRQSQNGTSVLKFSVAVDRDMGKDKEKSADFINCVAFGRRAEFINQYFGKGRMIAIEGNIRTGTYEDKDGNRRYTTDVWVDDVSFTGENKPNDRSSAGQPPVSGSIPEDFEDTLSDDGVPF